MLKSKKQQNVGKKSSLQGKVSRNIWITSEIKIRFLYRLDTVVDNGATGQTEGSRLLSYFCQAQDFIQHQFGDNTCYISSGSSDAKSSCNRLHPGNLKASHISSFLKFHYKTAICTCLEAYFYLGYYLIMYRQSNLQSFLMCLC